METQQERIVYDAILLPSIAETEERTPFIEGNTEPMEMQDLQDDYLVPVFSRDNVETISHTDFINTTMDAAQTYFQGEQFLEPQIRVSHEMKLRTRTGLGKIVENLNDKEDTGSYWQRMMFSIEIPSITEEVNGCELSLQIVGVRSYHQTNLLGNSSQQQTFQLGIGFLNGVCTNMCMKAETISLIKVTNTADLYRYAIELFKRYNHKLHLEQLRRLGYTQIPERTFAQILGRLRMYSALPQSVKTSLSLPEVILNEAQINAAVRDYYTDVNFGGPQHNMTGWTLYNLITNYKNNYIDTSLDRAANSFTLVSGCIDAINGTDHTYDWFIS